MNVIYLIIEHLLLIRIEKMSRIQYSERIHGNSIDMYADGVPQL